MAKVAEKVIDKASDASVIGREVRLGNTPHTIIGVMPEGYAFPVSDHYWVPLRLNAADVLNEAAGAPPLTR